LSDFSCLSLRKHQQESGDLLERGRSAEYEKLCLKAADGRQGYLPAQPRDPWIGGGERFNPAHGIAGEHRCFCRRLDADIARLVGQTGEDVTWEKQVHDLLASIWQRCESFGRAGQDAIPEVAASLSVANALCTAELLYRDYVVECLEWVRSAEPSITAKCPFAMSFLFHSVSNA
jgi:hypothetical protein